MNVSCGQVPQLQRPLNQPGLGNSGQMAKCHVWPSTRFSRKLRSFSHLAMSICHLRSEAADGHALPKEVARTKIIDRDGMHIPKVSGKSRFCAHRVHNASATCSYRR